MIRKKIFALFFLSIFLSTGILFAESFYEDPTRNLHAHPLQEIRKSTRAYARAKVDEVIRPATRRESGLVRATITSGKHSRKIIFAKDVSFRLIINRGDNIVISYDDNKEGPEHILIDGYDRTGPVVLLFLVFIFIALVVGRRKIIFPFIALSAGLLIIKLFFIPLVTAGHSPLLYSLITVTLMVIITMISIDKFSCKSVTAIVGSLAGLAGITVLIVIFYRLSGISGFYDENIQLLQFLNSPLKTKPVEYFRQIIIAVAVLASSGIIMDVAISISSSIKEISAVSYNLTFKKLLVPARQVASDIVATMVNTLIFAYIGASLGVLLVRGLYINSLKQLLNSHFFHVEFYQIVIGSTGFLICAGITVLTGSWIFSRFQNK